MKTKIVALVTLISLSLTGCSTFSGAQHPIAAVTQEAQIQHQAAVSALEAYCVVVEASDSELKAICDSVMPVALSSAPAVQTALSLITSILARRAAVTRAMAAAAERSVECHD